VEDTHFYRQREKEGECGEREREREREWSKIDSDIALFHPFQTE
jgi:hypothetical protein